MAERTPILRTSVPKARFEALEARIGAVNARARRMGAPELVLTVRAEEPVKVRRVRRVYVDGRWEQVAEDIMVPGLTVAVEGETPRIEGWKVAGHVNIKKAYIQADTGKVKAMPATGFLGFEAEDVRSTLVDRLDSRGRIPCDHCKTVRNRKEAFVLAREGNLAERVVVGSECVTDFTGHDPAAILRGYKGLLQARDDLERELSTYRVTEQYDWESFLAAERASRVTLVRFLAAAYEAARQDGFVPGGKADGFSTARAAMAALRSGREPSHEAFAVADEVMSWIPRMGYREDDLWKARRLGTDIGLDEGELAARCLLGWAQDSGRPLRGDYLGEVDERIEVELTVTSRGSLDLGYADRRGDWHERIVDRWRFLAPNGSRAYWDTGSKPDLAEGDTIVCRATVKDHVVSEKGTAVTVFSRLAGIRPKPPGKDGAEVRNGASDEPARPVP